MVETASVPLLEKRKKLEELMGNCVEDRMWGSLAGSRLVGGSSSSDCMARRTLDGEAWREGLELR